MKKGFSTIELMIALTILSLTLTAVVLVSFGNQSFMIGSQSHREALGYAKGLIGQTEARATKDFNLINSLPLTQVGIYDQSVRVILAPDFLTKHVQAIVSWKNDRHQKLSVELSTLFTNYEITEGGSTCNSTLVGDWTNPKIKNTTQSLVELIHTSGTYPITDLDVYHGKLYVTVNNPSSNNNSSLFIFDILESEPYLSLATHLDNSTVSAGLNAVVATDRYAYVANGYGANFSTCKEGNNCAQLQIFDLDDLSLPPINFKIPGVGGSGGQSVGNSIFYKQGYIYLGLTSTGGNGPEFHIIDVRNPKAPILVSSWPTSGNLGHNINAIDVKGSYVYLATPADTAELIIVDSSNISRVSIYDAPLGSVSTGNGKSLHLIGDNIYFGRTNINNKPEFYILDNHDPLKIEAFNKNPHTAEIGASANGVLVRQNIAFILTNNQLKILNISNPNLISDWAPPLSLPKASSSGGSSLDCEQNIMYAATKANGGIYIIGPQ